MARQRRKITNTSISPIQIAGRWIQPGGIDTFDVEQLPSEWKNAGVAVDDQPAVKVPAMISPGSTALEVIRDSAQGVVIYGPDGKIIMGTHAQGVVNVPQTGAAGAELLLASCTIPGGCLGPNGTLRVAAWLGVDVSNANLKTITIKYGGVVIGQNNNALTSARTARFECEAYGDNSEAAILALQTVGTTIAMQPASTGSGTVPASVAVDTTVDQLLEIYVNLAVATDVARVRRWAVDTRRGA